MPDGEAASPGTPTIRDVAALAGVSVATVSNFYNHPERMSSDTRDRIAGVVARLDYAPNGAASALRRGRNPVVGYLAFELASARTPAIANAISQRLAAAGMQLLSAVDGGDPARELAYLQLFERQRVSGLVVSPVADIEPQLARLRARGLPSVISARRARGPEQPSVSVDHVTGGHLAAAHLLGLGRRRLAFVTDTLELSQISERFDGARAAVGAVPGARLEVVWARARTIAAGERAAQELADRPASRRPDAVLGVNDLVAMGLVHGLRERLDVPCDVAVVGYDDIEFARLVALPLTTIRTPQEELGTRAADVLLAEIARLRSGDVDAAPAPQVELAPELVVRASSGG